MSARKAWASYKRGVPEGRFDAIVIGSGIGGLATAAHLSKEGKRVLVLEQHYVAGGFTHAFHRPGFDWDVGVHYVGGMQPGSFLRRQFDAIGDGSLDWADMGAIYDVVRVGAEEFRFPKGRRALKEALCARFPGEVRAIEGYFEAVAAVQKASRLYFTEKALPGLVATLAGGFLRDGMLAWSNRTTKGVLDDLGASPLLQAVLTTQYGDYGLPPRVSSFAIHAMVVNHYLQGGYYPVGGAGRIAESIAPVIESSGGAVLVSAEVASIVVEGGAAVGVRMADGAVVRAPLVISNAGVGLTFGKLLPTDVAARHGYDELLHAVRPSASHVSLYVGLSKTAEEVGLPKHNYWLYPHEDHDRALLDAEADPAAPLPLVYVSFPSAKDPDFEARHPGHATIELVTVAPWGWFSKWDGTRWKKRGADYEAMKNSLSSRLMAELERLLPEVMPHVVHAELSTPLSTKHFAAWERGEIYGIDHGPERFRQRWLKPKTKVPGLYLTGQDVVTCGVSGALLGGVLCASVLLKKNLLTGA
ncbi:MAG: NAD(P)/FAD-dependent oxidoreductase [Deltaproteobacteria bacterium]|nr:NAD(P)/FAD-dependent oxidoreductase [Deltaproteobacteria bacterium]